MRKMSKEEFLEILSRQQRSGNPNINYHQLILFVTAKKWLMVVILFTLYYLPACNRKIS